MGSDSFFYFPFFLWEKIFIIFSVEEILPMLPKVETPLEDQETVINYSKYEMGEWAEVYTTDKKVMKRYVKFCDKHPDYAKLLKEDKYSMTFSVHPKCASLFPKAPRKVVYSEEVRQKLRDNLARTREH